MDDIMILFHQMVVDLSSFNESQFGIFNDTEQPVLLKMFKEECGSSALKFFPLLSPEQKQHVVLWACGKTSFSTDELIVALKKFTKYLEKLSYSVYPKTNQSKKRKKKVGL
jgi:hypothetical protein